MRHIGLDGSELPAPHLMRVPPTPIPQKGRKGLAVGILPSLWPVSFGGPVAGVCGPRSLLCGQVPGQCRELGREPC